MTNLRIKFNDFVEREGNKIKEGFGTTLTKKISLTNSLTASGAIAAPLTYAHFMCERMYETGVVDRMYSPEFVERVIGTMESVLYTGNWMVMLPTTAILGAISLGSIGERLDRI